MQENEIFDRLAKHYLMDDGSLHPAFAEEYLTEEGEIDFRYIARKHDKRWTAAEAKRHLMHYFGKLKFEQPKAVDSIMYDEFKDHYEFGKYPDVRGWCTELYRLTNKVITRKTLYEYIYES